MGKTIKITETQYRYLQENIDFLFETLDNEALDFKTVKGTDNRMVSYRPGANSKIDDTIFFKRNNKWICITKILKI